MCVPGLTMLAAAAVLLLCIAERQLPDSKAVPEGAIH
jgi:hypothetical protein